MDGLSVLSSVIVIAFSLLLIFVVATYFIDIFQTRDGIRRNYPIIGRFRYQFPTIGQFVRRNFVATDREELPFNRAQRNWIIRSASGSDNRIAFGSSRPRMTAGTPIFVRTPFVDLDSNSPPTITFGENTTNPYTLDAIFGISGMGYGEISEAAVQALAIGARQAGTWLNTGEGGLTPYHLKHGCDLVFQIGTAKFGVRDENSALCDERLREVAAYEKIKMFEIALNSGANPGVGGGLAGAKVTQEIADIRGILVGRDCIPPSRHPEIHDVASMLTFVSHVRTVTQKPTGVKCIIGDYTWIEELCEQVINSPSDIAPDFIVIDSGDTGFLGAPMALADCVGLTITEALPNVANILTNYGLKEHIKLVVSGKLVTPEDVAWAYCAGADMVVSARGFMFALGCEQVLKCNQNVCPTGITTQDRRLQKVLDPLDKGRRVASYVDAITNGVNIIAHACGAPHSRLLERGNCRLVQSSGESVPLNILYPRNKIVAAAQKIFISYRRDDSRAFAEKLYDRLTVESSTGSIFMDRGEIRAGFDFGPQLMRALSACRVVLAIIGPHWLDITNEDGDQRIFQMEDFVRKEIRQALARKKILIPILIGGAIMPKAGELPDDIAELSNIQAISLDENEFDDAFSRLKRHVETLYL